MPNPSPPLPNNVGKAPSPRIGRGERRYATLLTMNKNTLLSYVLLVIIAGGAFYFFSTTQLSQPMEPNKPEQAVATPESTGVANVILKTNQGDIGIVLAMDKAPISAGNFLKLATDGFYNKVKFHRVISGFMIQAGDPNTKGDDTASYGTGGPGYTIADEFTNGLPNDRGTIAMANTGRPNSSGSQFFINLVDNAFLNGGYSVFGKVVSGMEVVDAIGKTQTANEQPVTPIVIESVEVK